MNFSLKTVGEKITTVVFLSTTLIFGKTGNPAAKIRAALLVHSNRAALICKLELG
ncbi:MAG: hypothetical protein IT258_14780 [Saprospiraceae bacterium]|nr:hypothetical protein [Saprospiraceae bacterium]